MQIKKIAGSNCLASRVGQNVAAAPCFDVALN